MNRPRRASPQSQPNQVLRVITRLNVGGPARHALILSRELAAEFPTTLAAGTPEPEEGELSDPDVPVVRLPLVRRVSPRLDMAALWSVRKLLAAERPSILHTHMAKAGAVARVAAFTSPRHPVVIHTFHGHLLDGYFSRPATRAVVDVERFLARHSDMLLAVSPEVRDALLARDIGTAERFRVVPVGLDLSRFAAVGPDSSAGSAFRRDRRIPLEVPLLGIVGRLVPVKDVASAIALLNRIEECHLAVVGDGEMRRALESDARHSGLADRVHFTGWADDVAAALAAVDVVVLTSRNEGTPVALIEAAAAGRPVVAADVGGVRHVVVDGTTGFLVRAGEIEEMATRVRQLLYSRNLRARMGSAGRQDALRRFDKARLVEEMGALYRELLTQRAP